MSRELAKAGRKKPIFKVSNLSAAQRALRMFNRMQGESRADTIMETITNFPEKELFQGRGRQNGEKAVFVIEEGNFRQECLKKKKFHLRKVTQRGKQNIYFLKI